MVAVQGSSSRHASRTRHPLLLLPIACVCVATILMGMSTTQMSTFFESVDSSMSLTDTSGNVVRQEKKPVEIQATADSSSKPVTASAALRSSTSGSSFDNPFLQYLAPTTGSDTLNSQAARALSECGGPVKARKSYYKYSHRRFAAFSVYDGGACAKPDLIGQTADPSNGRERDETKYACGIASLQQNDDGDCIIYSIGSNNMWKFEVSAHTMTKCEIHSFDCTGPLSRFEVPNLPRLHFHHWCLGTEYRPANPAASNLEETHASGFSLVGETLTLSQIQKRMNHSQVSLYKMDIEGYEFPIIESWLKEEEQQQQQSASTTTSWPMQILMEVHYRTQMRDLVPPEWFATNNETSAMWQDWKSYADLVKFNCDLLRLGYIVSIRDDNARCRHCSELTLIRISDGAVQG